MFWKNCNNQLLNGSNQDIVLIFKNVGTGSYKVWKDINFLLIYVKNFVFENSCIIFRYHHIKNNRQVWTSIFCSLRMWLTGGVKKQIMWLKNVVNTRNFGYEFAIINISYFPETVSFAWKVIFWASDKIVFSKYWLYRDSRYKRLVGKFGYWIFT